MKFVVLTLLVVVVAVAYGQRIQYGYGAPSDVETSVDSEPNPMQHFGNNGTKPTRHGRGRRPKCKPMRKGDIDEMSNNSTMPPCRPRKFKKRTPKQQTTQQYGDESATMSYQAPQPYVAS